MRRGPDLWRFQVRQTTVLQLVQVAAAQTAGFQLVPPVAVVVGSPNFPEAVGSRGLHSASTHHHLGDPSLGLALPNQVLVGPTPGRAGRCPNQRPRWRVAAGGLEQAGVLTVARAVVGIAAVAALVVVVAEVMMAVPKPAVSCLLHSAALPAKQVVPGSAWAAVVGQQEVAPAGPAGAVELAEAVAEPGG